MLIGSGRNEEYGGITGLLQSEVEVLKVLIDWNHQAYKSSYRNIADKCHLSTSSVTNALYQLKKRGIVSSSVGRAWFIIPEEKEKLKLALHQTSILASDKSASDKPLDQIE